MPPKQNKESQDKERTPSSYNPSYLSARTRGQRQALNQILNVPENNSANQDRRNSGMASVPSQRSPPPGNTLPRTPNIPGDNSTNRNTSIPSSSKSNASGTSANRTHSSNKNDSPSQRSNPVNTNVATNQQNNNLQRKTGAIPKNTNKSKRNDNFADAQRVNELLNNALEPPGQHSQNATSMDDLLNFNTVTTLPSAVEQPVTYSVEQVTDLLEEIQFLKTRIRQIMNDSNHPGTDPLNDNHSSKRNKNDRKTRSPQR